MAIDKKSRNPPLSPTRQTARRHLALRFFELGRRLIARESVSETKFAVLAAKYWLPATLNTW